MSLILIGIGFLVILIVGHELGHFFAAKAFKLRVDEFGVGFPPRIFSRKRGETIYSLNLLPFGGFVKIHGEGGSEDSDKDEPERGFASQPIWKRMIIIVAGVFMNFLIGWVAFSIVFSMGMPAGLHIEKVMPGSPAEQAGLNVGELIYGFSTAEEFTSFIGQNIGEEIIINDKTIVPRVDPPENEGAIGVVLFESGFPKSGIFQSIALGFESAVSITIRITVAFAGIIAGVFVGDFTVAGEVAGPVGIFNILGQASELGIASLIQFLGIISLNLVIINMIPFPALDGGKFLFLLIEKATGRPLSRKFELVANALGIAMLLLIMVAVTIRDIARL